MMLDRLRGRAAPSPEARMNFGTGVKQGSILILALLGAAVVFGFDWFELRYTEYAFERDCAAHYPAEICAYIAESQADACQKAATRKFRGRTAVAAREYRACLHAQAAEVAARAGRAR